LEYQRPHRYRLAEIRLLSSIAYVFGVALRISQLEKQGFELLLELETRKLVERGKGILQRDLGLSDGEAYLLLQRQSEAKQRPIKEIAQAVILSAEVRQNALPAG
jgi:AmiR/NasT family two-component response regulator